MPNFNTVLDAMNSGEKPKSFKGIWKLLYAQQGVDSQIAYVTPDDLVDALDEGISYILGIELNKFLSGEDAWAGFPLPYSAIIDHAISCLRTAGNNLKSEVGIHYGSVPCLNYLQSDLPEYVQLQEAFQAELGELAQEIKTKTGKSIELKLVPDVTNTVSLRIEARKLD